MTSSIESDKASSPQAEQPNRRQFLELAGAAIASAGIGSEALAGTPGQEAASCMDPGLGFQQAAFSPDHLPAGYNILFILTD
ncbi:TPA: twin-arginine translocation signal domain-containing protein [Burkholderia cenocepacia]|nr:twin-arginine translocation signal domain-containing protein [Burkholderia cenocepacia]